MDAETVIALAGIGGTLDAGLGGTALGAWMERRAVANAEASAEGGYDTYASNQQSDMIDTLVFAVTGSTRTARAVGVAWFVA